jgi:hypothetical protein
MQMHNMKNKLSTILFLFLASLSLQAQQVNDMVSMSAGYGEQVFYSMQSGEVSTANLSTWDLAFTTDPFDAAIFVNDHKGIQVYEYMGSISDWATLDTTGMLSSAIFNSDTSWSVGALNNPVSISPSPFDYGWGQYNPVTHIVNGNRIFILNFLDGTSRKILIESLNLGTFNFKYAMLDGSDEQLLSVNGTTYNTKNFWYLDMETATVLDLEPVSDEWDITFTRYTTEVFPGANYLVTGVFQNKGIQASEARNVLAENANWTDQALQSQRNIIGYDWKAFDMGTFTWVLEDSLSFFVKDQSSEIWKIIYTGFGGSANGNIEFTKELVGFDVSVSELEKISFSVFPNPSEGIIQWSLPEGMNGAQISLIDMSGRILTQERVIQEGVQQMDLSKLTSGMYLLQVVKDLKIAQEPILIH